MTLLINNKNKIIIITGGKISYLLCKNIFCDIIEKQINISKDKFYNYFENYLDNYDEKIDYKIFIVIRNPYTRIVSSYYAITNNKSLGFYKYYNNFKEFIDLLFYEKKNNNYNILNNSHVKEFSKQNGYEFFLNLLEKNNKIDFNIYETEELNNFIIDINKYLGKNYPIKKFHSFQYSKFIEDLDASLENNGEVLKKAYNYKNLLNNQIIEKINFIFNNDFIFSEKFGYKFLLN